MSSKLTLAIPCMNQLPVVKGILELMRLMTSTDVEWLIVDNGSTDDYETFLRKYLRPPKLNYIRNQENVGLVKTYQQIYEACTTPYLAYIHNDVFIYEQDWDKRVVKYFETLPNIGMVGFFGTQGCGPEGQRIQKTDTPYQSAGMSNMLEAEVHGMRMEYSWRSVTIFDGFALIIRKDILDKAHGIDQQYHYFHLYDRELGLLSLSQGYHNIVVNIPCHHIGGQTSCQSEYQDWITHKMGVKERGDLATHEENTKIFSQKWKDILPLYVNDDFTFSTETFNNWHYKDLNKKL